MRLEEYDLISKDKQSSSKLSEIDSEVSIISKKKNICPFLLKTILESQY